MKPVTNLILFGLIALVATSVLGADEYAKGHGALEVFDDEGMAVAPLWVQLWVAFMLLNFAIGLVFAWKHPIARWTSGGIILSMTTSTVIFQALGLPFLSGSIAIMHIVCWTPALVLLLMQRPFMDPEAGLPFRLWSGTITGVIIFSFVFDIRDAAIYINHVAGLS